MTVTLWGGDHSDLVRAVSPSSLEFYFPLAETSGTQATDISGKGRNGTYNGPALASVTTPFGKPAPLFDAINDYVDIYSAALATALATWSEGTIAALCMVRAASVWTDATTRNIVQISDSGVNNRASLTKNSSSNQLRNLRSHAGTTVANVASTTSPTDWFYIVQTWSVANNRLNNYIAYRGVAPAQFGTQQTGLAAWSAVTLAATRCLIGNSFRTTPANIWDGYIAEVSGWSSELTLAQATPFMAF